VTRTPGTPRRARNKSSNIAQGMPACVRLYLLTTRVRFLRMHCTRERGCNGTRHSLRPRLSGGSKFMHHSGAISVAGMRLHALQHCSTAPPPSFRLAPRNKTVVQQN
jgi:hypothetical protein